MAKTLRTVALLAAIAAGTCANARDIALDLRAPSKAGRRAMVKSAGSVKSAVESVQRASDLAAGATDVGEVATGDALSVTLFDDVTLDITLGEKMPSPLGGDVFLASVDGKDGPKTAVVLRDDSGLTIDVQDTRSGKVYKVVSTSEGVKVKEIKPEGESRCGCPKDTPSLNLSAIGKTDKVAAPNSLAGTVTGAVTEQGNTCVDILVAYDRNATAYANENGGGITNFAVVAVQKMNTALANTGLDSSFRFRLVGVTTVNTALTDVEDALYAIRDNATGWAEIKTVREETGADIVTTLIDTGTAYGTTGIGWALESGNYSYFADSAYNVCSIRSVAISHTMSHECGHNMGAGHADTQASSPGPQLYKYSAGYYFTGTNNNHYCTIMAYNYEGPGGSATRQIPFFSSPSYYYQGVAVGTATANDNTRTIRETYANVVNFRAAKVKTSYDVIFDPDPGSLIDSTTPVTLSPGKSGIEIRYTLDGSEPTPSSHVYSRPFYFTKTTTIKACTVVDGVCSFPFSATYYLKDDIGYALGLPDWDWIAEGDWSVQEEDTTDGLAVSMPGEIDGAEGTLSADVTGPVILSFKRLQYGAFAFNVYCDDDTQILFSDVYDWDANGSVSYEWQEAAVSIPAGKHTLVFSIENQYGDDWPLFALDAMKLYYAHAPEFSPSAAAAGGVYEFEDEVLVSLSSEDEGASIYYTLDGSDPGGQGALRYETPIYLDKTTRIRAMSAVPGKGMSMVSEMVFRNVNEVKAGVWTLDVDAAYDKVVQNGRLIAELCWEYNTCWHSQQLAPVITDPDFLAWAKMNGVYLLADSWADETCIGEERFWNLYSQTQMYADLNYYIYWPTFVFASPEDTSTCLGAMLARSGETTNDITYTGTPESLVKCFASFLTTAAPLGAPVASLTNTDWQTTFPFNVTLSNPNSSGSIYWTLDGSEPTRTNGTLYTGPVTITQPGITLRAAVWPDDASGISSIPISIRYPDDTSLIPDAPAGLAASMDEYALGVLFRWKAVDDADAYLVYRSSDLDAANATLIDTTERNYFWDLPCTAGVTNYYWVASTNAYGMSAKSGPVGGSKLKTSIFPDVASSATATDVNEALESAELADETNIKSVIDGDAAKYTEFTTWAKGIGEADVAASRHAAASFVLGYDGLFTEAPTIEIDELEVEGESGALVLSVTVKEGENAVAVAVEKVKALFEATSDLGDWESAAAKLTPQVSPDTTSSGTTMRFHVLPGTGTSGKAFLRIRAK